jgi:hypothetical protein
MYITDYLKKYENKKIKLFIDMDGVIADYDVFNAGNYDKKRPLKSSIKVLEEISKWNNIEMYILSITRFNEGFQEKNIWLDKYINFVPKDHRIIISRESNNFIKSKTLKSSYFKKLKRDDSIIILIDDDPRVLEAVNKHNPDVLLLKDTALVL